MNGELKVTDHEHGMSFITLAGMLDSDVKFSSTKNIGRMLTKAKNTSATKVMKGVKLITKNYTGESNATTSSGE